MQIGHTLASLVLVLSFLVESSAIICWKCISQDCHEDPESNHKAQKVTCDPGASCMKVRYTMYDNIRAMDSTIRTCSNRCLETSKIDFEKCMESNRTYMVSGCTLKSCCKDTDLCNGVNSIFSWGPYIMFVAFLVCYFSMELRDLAELIP